MICYNFLPSVFLYSGSTTTTVSGRKDYLCGINDPKSLSFPIKYVRPSLLLPRLMSTVSLLFTIWYWVRIRSSNQTQSEDPTRPLSSCYWVLSSRLIWFHDPQLTCVSLTQMSLLWCWPRWSTVPSPIKDETTTHRFYDEPRCRDLCPESLLLIHPDLSVSTVHGGSIQCTLGSTSDMV